MYVSMYKCICICMYVCIYVLMYCLYVGVDYTYIDVNTLAQGIKSFLASHVWFHININNVMSMLLNKN